jgi:signal peptidase
MKNKSIFLISLVSLAVLISAQAVYILLPPVSAAQFIHIRPLIYFVIFVMYILLNGREERPIIERAMSTILARFVVIGYFAVLLALGIFFSFGINATGYGITLFFSNLWAFGVIVVISEYLRFRFIKSVATEQRSFMSVTTTIVYMFIQLDALRGLMRNENFVEFLFASVVPVLALNAVLSYIAYDGSLMSLLMIRVTYSLTPILLPFMPNLSKEIWAVISSLLLLATLIFYHYNMNVQTGRLWRTRNVHAKQQKYEKKSRLIPIITVSVIAVLALFIGRVFVYFPIVVLTDSMTGTIDRSSVVIVEKVRTDEVYHIIKTGDIILYKCSNIEIMHRVIETRENELGETVYITQGDANPEADFYTVGAGQIIGITRSYIPHIGYPIVVINSLFNR